ncbi:protein LITTLE ZIPPER 2-like [Hibiscus syriacus]|uniref:protein LITTLE ZIPPER 2-like n=1 Tax=Hibiscus syriacus TaxID=106335 RepID=UPI00192511AB|nr:protein LITTLE ZIPPER 2-like [Hibiscus syriacus]
MCNMAWSPCPPHPTFASSKRRHKSKQSKVQICRLSRKKWEENVEKDMELMNLKLYLENQSIIEENEKLRKKVNLLHQESFNVRVPEEVHSNRFPTTLLLLLQQKTLMVKLKKYLIIFILDPF